MEQRKTFIRTKIHTVCPFRLKDGEFCGSPVEWDLDSALGSPIRNLDELLDLKYTSWLALMVFVGVLLLLLLLLLMLLSLLSLLLLIQHRDYQCKTGTVHSQHHCCRGSRRLYRPDLCHRVTRRVERCLSLPAGKEDS